MPTHQVSQPTGMDPPMTPPPATRQRREDEPLKYTKSVSPLPSSYAADLEASSYETSTFSGAATVGFSSSTSREVPGLLSPVPAHRRGANSPQYRSDAESQTPFGAQRSRDFGTSGATRSPTRSPLSVRVPGIGFISYRAITRLALDTFTSLVAQLSKNARTYAVQLRSTFGVQPPPSPSALSPHRPLSLEPESKPWAFLLDPESSTDFWQQTWPNIFKALAVLQWWFFNVLLILLNKWIYQMYHFNFPLTLTSVHFALSFVGAFICIRILGLKPLATVSRMDLVTRVLPMAVVTNLNVCLGNMSLRWIPVTFMQTVKAFTPAVTVALQCLFQGRSFDVLVYMSLFPVVGGVTLASATELSFHLWGFLAALTSTVFTSVNSILAEVLLKGHVDMDSINTVYYMAPQNMFMLLPLAMAFEGAGVVSWLMDDPLPNGGQNMAVGLVLFSGVLAFGLNFSLFFAIQATSAMTFNVAGNLKVALAILLGWLIFRNPVSYLNALGCAITVVGCTWYGYVMSTTKPLASPQGSGLLSPTSEQNEGGYRGDRTPEKRKNYLLSASKDTDDLQELKPMLNDHDQ